MYHGSVMFKRKDVLALGGYNEAFKPGEFWPEYGCEMWEDRTQMIVCRRVPSGSWLEGCTQI